MVVSQVDDNPGTLGGILWFYDSWWHYIGIICAWPLIKYIYIFMFMMLDGHWQSVCVYVCVWFSNHETCCLNYNMFVVLTCPPLQVSVCVCLVQQSWYLLFELQHVFLFWTAPTPPGFNLSMTTVCMCFVWFNNHDTCCLNYSMIFVLNCPHPSRFQFKHDYCVYVFCLVL